MAINKTMDLQYLFIYLFGCPVLSQVLFNIGSEYKKRKIFPK